MTVAQPHSQACKEQWIFGEPAPSAKGFSVKVFRDAQAPLAPPKLQLCLDGEAPLKVASVLGGRVLLDINENSELVRSLQDLDSFVLDVAYQKCQSWFNRSISTQQLAAMLNPVVAPEQRTLELPLSPDACVWALSPDGTYVASEISAVTEGRCVWVCAEVATLTFAHRHFGVTLAVSDVLLLPQSARPSFAFQSSVLLFQPAPLQRGDSPDEPAEA